MVAGADAWQGLASASISAELDANAPSDVTLSQIAEQDTASSSCFSPTSSASSSSSSINQHHHYNTLLLTIPTCTEMTNHDNRP